MKMFLAGGVRRVFPKQKAESAFFPGSWLFCAAAACLAFAPMGRAQTAVVSDAWWTYEQDCDGDTFRAGTLTGDFARLNWFPDVVNCYGTLTVYEIVSYRPCGTAPWIPIYTNTPHVIVGCRAIDQQYIDVQMGGFGTCRDYMIEVYRSGQTTPDSRRSSTNDVHLAQRKEEQLLEDVCASDMFATCVNLSGASGSQTDNNAAASKEPDEPNHAGNSGGHSLWYCWTAPTNKPVTFDTLGSTFDTLLAVYAGSSVGSLTLVTNNDDIAGATNRMSRVSFTPVTGTTYHVAVDGFGGASGIVQLNWNQGGTLPDLLVWGPSSSATMKIVTTTLLANDCQVIEGCATAGARKLLCFDMETRNIGSGDLVLPKPNNNPLFRFALCHGHYHFESFAQYTLLDTNYNPVFVGTNVVAGRKVGFCIVDVSRWLPTASSNKKYICAADGSRDNGIQAGWADIYAAYPFTACQFVDITSVPAGEYFLQLTVNPDGLIAESDMSNNSTLLPVSIPPTNCLVAPANDLFTNAVAVTATPFTAAEFNNCASKQTGEPNHANNAGGHSLWYAWTPTSNHTAVINTKGSDFDTTLGVYTGNAVNALSLVASNDDIIAGTVKQSRVSFNAVAETTYRIAVDGFGTAVGAATLNVNPPVNDDFASNQVITGVSGSVTSFNVGASKEVNETAHAFDIGGHSVWFRWNAPTNGVVDFNTLGSSFDTLLAVYTNATLGSTNLAIASNDDDTEGGGLLTSHLWFFARAGTNYYVAVDGFGGEVGDFKLNWNMDSRLAIANLPDGSVQVSLTGVDWHRYVLLGSTNLRDWATNTAAITMAGGAHQYTNWPGTNAPDRQYYKAVRVP